MRKKIGIFGGTFDPIHLGHLRMALELKQQLALDEMRLVPCCQPPHRDAPQATAVQRAEMLHVALKNCRELQIDERELWRDRPSYTYETLQDLRAELGAEVSLVLCMGEDAFAGFSSWFRWQEIIQLAHIAVVARPSLQWPVVGEVNDFLHKYQREPQYIDQHASGSVVLQRLRLLPISATEIRQQISREESAQFLLPDDVWQYIALNHLYK